MTIRTSYGLPRRIGPLVKGLLLAGAAVGAPALVSSVIRRRAEPPQPPRWGRAHRYSGRHGEIVFQELGLRGDRPPVVLLHSFGPGHDANEWRATAERLAERYAVYAPDLPGWGRSGAAFQRTWNPKLYVEAIDAFLAGVVREPAILIASGMTAAYAVRIAAEHPGRLRALGLVCPVGLEPGAQSFVGKLLRLPVLRDTVLDLVTSRSAITHYLRKQVYAAPERVDAALLDHHYRASHMARSRAALAAWLGGELGDNVAETLPEIGLPVWIAWGRQSAAPRVEDADRWLHGLPHTAELEVFETSGALPHAEAPAAFCRALDRFIAGIS
ncbi:MAG TPA: alpha/beta fold hydrolase [Thermoanaerobaculia bacterium]|jgi:pimeloyl-ACP methyl ester carboxylesterase|nr:alpha/beta fold hydrolase [Thermoanaerobaculia bacterium]